MTVPLHKTVPLTGSHKPTGHNQIRSFGDLQDLPPSAPPTNKNVRNFWLKFSFSKQGFQCKFRMNELSMKICYLNVIAHLLYPQPSFPPPQMYSIPEPLNFTLRLHIQTIQVSRVKFKEAALDFSISPYHGGYEILKLNQHLGSDVWWMASVHKTMTTSHKVITTLKTIRVPRFSPLRKLEQLVTTLIL